MGETRVEQQHFGKQPKDHWERWDRYRKKVTTPATRIYGPFSVETREGTLRCEDGWLAIDSQGNPYPIAADEFDAIYEPVSPTPTGQTNGE